MAPSRSGVTKLAGRGITQTGTIVTGWMRKSEENSPIAVCYLIKTLMKTEAECEDESEGGEMKSSYIKPQTVFGICGTSYIISNNRPTINFADRGGNTCVSQ